MQKKICLDAENKKEKKIVNIFLKKKKKHLTFLQLVTSYLLRPKIRKTKTQDKANSLMSDFPEENARIST
jgi:hypothetical protein